MGWEEILKGVQDGSLSIEEAQTWFKRYPSEYLGFAKLDTHRKYRSGFAEVVFCQSKTVEHLVAIFQKLHSLEGRVLGTRCSQEQYEALARHMPKHLQYDPVSRIVKIEDEPIEKVGFVAVCTAGTADIAVAEGLIVGMGDYSGAVEYDMTGKLVLPGFVDAHIHLESSLVSPKEFARAVLPHGTTTVITDPHEIANVMGTDGIEYMLQATEDLPVDVRFMLPSCVPATPMDESGANLDYRAIDSFYDHPRVQGLAEMMNFVGAINGDQQVVEKIVEIPMHLQFDYLVMNDVMKIIKDANLTVMNPVYDMDCSFDLLCPKSCHEALRNRLLKVESLVLE